MGHLGASVSPSRDVDLTGGSHDVAGRRLGKPHRHYGRAELQTIIPKLYMEKQLSLQVKTFLPGLTLSNWKGMAPYKILLQMDLVRNFPLKEKYNNY